VSFVRRRTRDPRRAKSVRFLRYVRTFHRNMYPDRSRVDVRSDPHVLQLTRLIIGSAILMLEVSAMPSPKNALLSAGENHPRLKELS